MPWFPLFLLCLYYQNTVYHISKRLRIAAAFALAIFSGKNIFIIYNSEKPAGFSELLFHERGRREKLHLIKQQPFFVTAFL
ncbi:hypothetical protein HMPREF9436_01324 [Faecalibacterium cf. prausnitzii KLE1255]|uniref:Uncharacterized protein n=1 Tax=Faecalibacterium cf. prausnitzii KLE1255 TaxID=748224 RepID=E2ZI33_9FIRM|nr:hypothetical protein HMPREF9436_01324 [Faecalibacterium cf. prausnitzii KLE1255]